MIALIIRSNCVLKAVIDEDLGTRTVCANTVPSPL